MNSESPPPPPRPALFITTPNFIDELALAISEAVLDCHEFGRSDLLVLRDYAGGDDLETLRPADLQRKIREKLADKLLQKGAEIERTSPAAHVESWPAFGASIERRPESGPGRDLNNQPLMRGEVLQLLLDLLCDAEVSYSLGSSSDAGTWLNDCDVIDQDKLQNKIQSLLDADPDRE